MGDEDAPLRGGVLTYFPEFSPINFLKAILHRDPDDATTLRDRSERPERPSQRRALISSPGSGVAKARRQETTFDVGSRLLEGESPHRIAVGAVAYCDFVDLRRPGAKTVVGLGRKVPRYRARCGLRFRRGPSYEPSRSPARPDRVVWIRCILRQPPTKNSVPRITQRTITHRWPFREAIIVAVAKAPTGTTRTIKPEINRKVHSLPDRAITTPRLRRRLRIPLQQPHLRRQDR